MFPDYSLTEFHSFASLVLNLFVSLGPSTRIWRGGAVRRKQEEEAVSVQYAMVQEEDWV